MGNISPNPNGNSSQRALHSILQTFLPPTTAHCTPPVEGLGFTRLATSPRTEAKQRLCAYAQQFRPPPPLKLRSLWVYSSLSLRVQVGLWGIVDF